MKYKADVYLLKPCNEEQTNESMQDVIKEHYHQKAFQDLQNKQKMMTANVWSTSLLSVTNTPIYSTPEETITYIRELLSVR